MKHKDELIRAGTRFIVLHDFRKEVLIHLHAPMTDGFTCLIPEGTVLVTFRDSPATDSSFSCTPENPESFLEDYVREEVRKSPKFAGLSMVFLKREIGELLRQL